MSDAVTPPPARRLVTAAVVIVVALVVGWFAVAKSLGVALANKAPDTALRIDRGNALAMGQSAMRELQQDPGPKGRARAVRRAQAAIVRDATGASALSVIGLAGRDAHARRALLASEALSRRTLPTQLGLIEEAVSRNDVQGALRHYDIALRTSRGASAMLFPVLVSAPSDPDLLPAMAQMLARRPEWGPLYLQQVAQVGKDLPNIAQLFRRVVALKGDPGALATGALYPRLIEARLYEDAWKLYAATNPRASRAGVRGGNFAAIPPSPTPFDWITGSDGTVTTDILPGDAQAGGRMEFTSNPGEGGLIARQLLLLTPGRHELTATVSGVKAAEEAQPLFRVECAAGNTEVASLPLPDAGETARRGRWSFVVPAGCPAQWLSIVIPPPATSETIGGTIGAIHVD